MRYNFGFQWKESVKRLKARPWQFASIPITAAAVGYITNYVGVSMLFYPVEWTGIDVKRWPHEPLGLFGWQGIVPAKRFAMTQKMTDVTLTKLLTIKEIFDKLEPMSMSKILSPDVSPVVFGGYLPLIVVEYFLKNVAEEVSAQVESLVSIRDIVLEGMTKDPSILGGFFQRVGSKELKFLVDSGTYFGFLLGFIQMACWMIIPFNWTLPLGGAVVGFVTNWIALKLIFEPVEPVQCLGFSIQGLFLARQSEVSAEFSKYIAKNTLTSQALWGYMLEDVNSIKLLEDIIKTQVPFLTGSMVDDVIECLKKTLLQKDCGNKSKIDSSTNTDVDCHEELAVLHPLHEYINLNLDLKDTLIEKMKVLTPYEFERILHPIFEEDELTLIVAGGVLGMIAGSLQWWLNLFLDKKEKLATTDKAILWNNNKIVKSNMHHSNNFSQTTVRTFYTSLYRNRHYEYSNALFYNIRKDSSSKKVWNTSVSKIIQKTIYYFRKLT